MTPIHKQNIEQARSDLQNTLDNAHPVSFYVLNGFYKFVNNNNDNFYDRNNLNGHITSSCFAIDKTHTKILLVHHKKIEKWLQPGGHWDSVNENYISVFDNAYKELTEEAYGERQIDYKILNGGQAFDLDVHGNFNHKHYDIGFLLEIDEGIELSVSDESLAVEWMDMDYVLANRGNYEFSSKRLTQVILKIKSSPNLDICASACDIEPLTKEKKLAINK